MKFIIPIKPFGKARPRVPRRGRPFMPAIYKQNISDVQRLVGFVPEDGKLYGVSVAGYRKIPKSGPNKKRQHGEFCSTGVDSDNLVGAIMDALWPDNDNVVVWCKGVTVWGTHDAISIEIQEMQGAYALADNSDMINLGGIFVD